MLWNSQSFIYLTAWLPLILIFQTLFGGSECWHRIKNSRTNIFKGTKKKFRVIWHLVAENVHHCYCFPSDNEWDRAYFKAFIKISPNIYCTFLGNFFRVWEIEKLPRPDLYYSAMANSIALNYYLNMFVSLDSFRPLVSISIANLNKIATVCSHFNENKQC